MFNYKKWLDIEIKKKKRFVCNMLIHICVISTNKMHIDVSNQQDATNFSFINLF